MAGCLTPYGVKNKMTNETIPVPCGKCPECLKRRVSGWSFRLMQEDKVSQSSMFLTLTYDTGKVPISRNGFMELKKRDLQLFFKRLRKLQQLPIKYYAVGEYGGKTKRPHYHIIIFNASLCNVQGAWGLGHIHYGLVTGASVGYTLKYMTKKRSVPMHRNDDRIPEFSLMSKGLGKSYLSHAMVEWHKNDLLDRMYCNVEDKKIAMPRYYKDKIYDELQRKRVAFFQRQKMVAEQLKAMGDHPEAYWRDKAENDKAAFNRMHNLADIGRNKI